MLFVPLFPVATSPDSRRKRERRIPHCLGRLLVSVAAVAVGACGDVVDVQEARVVGLYNDHQEPKVPRAMNAGRSSAVTIWTVGNGCVRGGDTDVVIYGRTVVVTPYDFVRVGGDAGCYDIRKTFEHTVSVALSEPGTWTLVFRYNTSGGPPPREADGLDVRQVEVLP